MKDTREHPGLPVQSIMAIKIERVDDDLYCVSASPPEASEIWSPPERMTGREATKGLIAKGCHQQDVGDAMYAADPNWVEKLRGPDVPRILRH
jgi:hypothetical protein